MRNHNPEFLCLAETKVDNVASILNFVGFFHFVIHPPLGRQGGLLLAWRVGVDVEVVCVNANAINVLVYFDPSNTPWLLTRVYGPTNWHLKPNFWNSLQDLTHAFAGPWLCLGDFNCILNSGEKRGGRPFASSSYNPFSNFMDSCGLIDLGFKGQKFTWSNNRDGVAKICERLDRAIANTEWQSLFPRSRITHLLRSSSDQSPILLNTDGDVFSYLEPFRFEAMWIRDSTCE